MRSNHLYKRGKYKKSMYFSQQKLQKKIENESENNIKTVGCSDCSFLKSVRNNVCITVHELKKPLS